MCLTKQEYIMIMKNTKNHNHRLAFKFAYECGLKISEVIDIKSEHINMKEGMFFVHRYKKRYCPLPNSFMDHELNLFPISCGIRALQIAFRKQCKKLGFNYSFKDLRWGFLVQQLAEGKNPEHILYLTGLKRFPNFHGKTTDGKRPIPLELRMKVFQRDNFRCKFCGRTAKEIKLHTDHIFPVSKGGKTNLDNLQTLCQDCNLGKKDNIFIHKDVK